jgi:hypothetical protein
MAKSKYRFDDYDEEDFEYEFKKKKEEKNQNRRNTRRLKNALKSKSIDPDIIQEYEDF